MKIERFLGVNAGYVAELYERYRQQPESVDAETRAVFDAWGPQSADLVDAPASVADVSTIVGAANLVESIRRYGHLAATLDPLGTAPTDDPTLAPSSHGVTDEDLRKLPASLVGGPVAYTSTNASEAIEKLRRVYSSTTGFDYAHMFVPEEREWLRHAAESGRFLPPMEPHSAEALLDRLTSVEVFEHFLHQAFPGKTRFSVEGLDMLIPMLDEILCSAADQGVRHALLGMAHRGRLNVLAHVLDKPSAQILAEFKDPVQPMSWLVNLGWMGDVKYHAGARTAGPRGQLYVTLVPNPSHLEAVNPVVAGMARAAGTHADQPGPSTFDSRITLPILIHGDAAFPGQGVVAETLNLSRLPGYNTGGTIHIIANNQLGFTATPEESYSTSYASGLARGFKIPVVHVNADDPVACLEAARMAAEYRSRFGRDFLIDLVGYRRHGHNEGDEAAFTQPLMYQAIGGHPTVRAQFARAQVDAGQLSPDLPDTLVRKHREVLETALASLQPEEAVVLPVPTPAVAGAAARVDTGVTVDRLRELSAGLFDTPAGFTFHKKLERGRERRRASLINPSERSVDWATAEELAFASILADGIPIRLTGEDVERGTFSQRHAVFHDAVKGTRLIPLQSSAHARAAFDVYNSPLTENATIGFELGYGLHAPNTLVIWEGQYGDFINGAQVVLDEFVTSGRAKWGMKPALVFLLPHAYEGQGPDHSTARPERILQAAADTNLRLANCTTAAQYFHLLRRQAHLLATDPLPLFVLTPKSLLRHPAVRSTPLELEHGRFLSVIDDEESRERRGSVTRLVICSGKVYVDLVTSPRRAADPHVAICRVEQLFPFPGTSLGEVLEGYEALTDVVWLQEEPENMGAWDFMRPRLEELIGGRCPLRYVGRVRSASPAEGSAAWHQASQSALIDQAFIHDERSPAAPLVLSKPA